MVALLAGAAVKETRAVANAGQEVPVADRTVGVLFPRYYPYYGGYHGGYYSGYLGCGQYGDYEGGRGPYYGGEHGWPARRRARWPPWRRARRRAQWSAWRRAQK
jgi:hypothetical protein